MIALVRSQFSGVRDQLIWLLNGPEQVPGSDNDNELLHTLDTLITIDHILNIIFCITLLLAFIHFEVQHRLNMDQEDMLIGADEDVVMDSDVEMGDTEDGLQHQMDKSLDKGLPLPSSAGDVQYVDIAGAKKDKLQEWCRSFKLHVSGNKEDLKDRLRCYSQDTLREAWNNLTHPNAQRMHRGPRDGGVLKSKAGSKKRKNTVDLRHKAIFGKPATQPTPHGNVSGCKDDKDRPQSIEEHSRLLNWAENIVRMSPYIPKVERDRLREEAAKQNSGVKLAPDLETEITMMRKDIQSLVRSSSTTHSCPSTRHNSPNSNLDPPRTSLPSPIPYLSTCSSSQSPTYAPSDFVPPPPPATSALATGDSTFRRSIQIGNGIALNITEDDLSDPPPLSFTSDEIDDLNAMWDYTPPHWQNKSPLIVQNYRIPIKYWRNLYDSHIKLPSGQQWKAKQWNTVKPYYSKWRIIVARWRRLSQEDFWHDFTLSDGSRMTFTAMTNELSAIRAREDADLAHQARVAYGDQFSNVFSYKKGVRHIVKTRNVEIARQYRKLKHIESDWDLDED